jgi:putative two-component system hydrogenase maturation factor HypX/HoxX
MRILLISSAFSGLTQRFYTELSDAGYTVSVELHSGDIAQLLEGVSLFKPDLILCPYLTRRIPQELYENYRCLIVHPGIKGDRGPSSLDWAIQNGEREWGVTLLQAAEVMDAGDVWASKTFPMRAATKSSLFYREVTQAAVDCLWEALTYFDAPDFKPEPLDYGNPSFKGELRPLMKQADRTINWARHKTRDILRRIQAADGSPGLLDEIDGHAYYLFNAHEACGLTGKPGEIIAMTDDAICRATVDGAIWIGHLQARLESGEKGIKLPAAMVLKDSLAKPIASSPLKQWFAKPLRHIDIDYARPGRQLSCQEVWHEQEGKVAYIYFPFHNGAMSTGQCQRLLSVYRHVATLDINVIVLMGGEENWSNGIHLNHIERADDPAKESWLNINAMNDLIYQIITTLDKLTVSAVAGNAGAGGAILAIASDWVFAREGVIFNPHYKNMGELYGSEYWTYLLPKRVGLKTAISLTEQRLPISAKKAWRIGLIDKVLDRRHASFVAQIKHLVRDAATDAATIKNALAEKARTRCFDEASKPLASYRQFELAQMYANFYGNQDYHAARRRFVYKQAGDAKTPENIASHRQRDYPLATVLPGSLGHFLWREAYRMGDEQVDGEHKDLFELADRLIQSKNHEQLQQRFQLLVQHVKDHFQAEETFMRGVNYPGYRDHASDHQNMMDYLCCLGERISDMSWKQNDLETFLQEWGRHIIDYDMVFNNHSQERKAALVD